VPATGSVASSQDSKLSFGGAGTVAGVSVQTGTEVTAGQELARIDTADLERSVRRHN
jgi:multidrug efflux pump subunit AcrA (membrane-fusion protein)